MNAAVPSDYDRWCARDSQFVVPRPAPGRAEAESAEDSGETRRASRHVCPSRRQPTRKPSSGGALRHAPQNRRLTDRDIWNGVKSKAARRIPRESWPIVRRKLDQVDAATRLDDLKVPPGNRLHALAGSLRGLHAVRVNDQYRMVFRFEGADAFDVRCTDYH